MTRKRAFESIQTLQVLHVFAHKDDTSSHEQRRFVDLVATQIQSLQIYDPLFGLRVRKRNGESTHADFVDGDADEEDKVGYVVAKEVEGVVEDLLEGIVEGIAVEKSCCVGNMVVIVLATTEGAGEGDVVGEAVGDIVGFAVGVFVGIVDGSLLGIEKGNVLGI